jgi:hypothetical protein
MSRLTVRDRFWADNEVVKVIGPLSGLTADAVRAALRGMYADRPHAKALSRLDRGAARWRPVPPSGAAAWLSDLVLDLDGDEDADKVAARMLSEPLGARPLLFGAGGPYAAVRLSHAVGDARVAGPLFTTVLAAAAQGGPAAYPFPSRTRLPLLRAAARHLGAQPGRIPAALRVSRPPAGAAGTGERVPWAPGVAHHWARSAVGGAARLRRWRDAQAPGASVGAVLAAAVSAAFRAHLPAPARPGLVMLVDARRYLPAGAVVDGNFAVGEYLAPADPTDPRAVHAELTGRLHAGRSLTMLAAHNVRLLLGGRAAPAPRDVPRHPRPQLTLTYLGRSDAYAALPWDAGFAGRRMVDLVGPAGPQGVTVAVEEFGDVLHATTTYHGNVFSPAEVAAATAALLGDPAALLAR